MSQNIIVTQNKITTTSNKRTKAKAGENEIKKNSHNNYIMSQYINRGTGAGGSSTNATGLPYENITNLNTEYSIISQFNSHNIISFSLNPSRQFICTHKSNFFKYLKHSKNNNIPDAHGCKQPDECYIDEDNKIIFIIEKKFQQVSGSVCEKIQTAPFKKRHYSLCFPMYQIIYIYCLSDWFKIHCKAEIEYLEYEKIPIFWGSSDSYKHDIVNFILNFK